MLVASIEIRKQSNLSTRVIHDVLAGSCNLACADVVCLLSVH